MAKNLLGQVADIPSTISKVSKAQKITFNISWMDNDDFPLHQHLGVNQNVTGVLLSLLPGLKCVHMTFVYAPSSVRHSNPTSTSHCTKVQLNFKTTTMLPKYETQKKFIKKQ